MKRLVSLLVLLLLVPGAKADEATDVQIIRGLVRDGTWTIAVNRMENYLTEYPDGPHRREVREMLVSACLAARFYDRVHAAAKAYVADYCEESTAACAPVILADATAYYLEQQYQDAEDRLARLFPVLNMLPSGELQAYHRLAGDVAFARNRYQDALDSYNRFLKLAMDNEVRLRQGIAYFHLKKYGRAKRVFNRLRKEGASSPELYRYLGLIAFREQKYDVARDLFERAGADQDRIYQVHALVQLDRLEAAYRVFREVVPLPEVPADELALWRLKLAVIEGRYDDALSMVGEATLPDSNEARDWTVRLLDDLRRFKEAAQVMARTALVSEDPGRAFYQLGEYRLTRLNDRKGAFEAYSRSLDKDPNGPFASLAEMNRIQCALYMGDEERALSLTTEFLDRYGVRSPLTDKAYLILGRLMLDRGRYEDAIRSFENILANYPESDLRGDAGFLLADAYFRSGMYADARRAARGEVSDRYQADAILISGDAAFLAGDMKAAVSDYLRLNDRGRIPRTRCAIALALSDRMSEALDMAGDDRDRILTLYVRRKDAEGAVRVVLAEDPLSPERLYRASGLVDDPALRIQLLSKVVELTTDQSVVHRLAKIELVPLMEASGDWLELLQLEPAYQQYDPAGFTGAQALLKKARGYREKQKLSKAVASYRMAVKLFPEAPGVDEAYYFLYRYVQPRDPALLETIVQKYPDGEYMGLAAYKLGVIRFKQKNYREAIPLFQRTLERNDPALADLQFAIHYYLGVSMEKTGDVEGAMIHYREYLASLPEDVKQVNERIRIALLFQKNGHCDDAMAEFRRLLSLPEAAGHKAELTFYSAECLEAGGQLEDALQQYLAVTYLHSKEIMWSTTARFRAARICEQLEYYDDAIKLYRKIADAHKNQIQGDFALKKLQELTGRNSP